MRSDANLSPAIIMMPTSATGYNESMNCNDWMALQMIMAILRADLNLAPDYLLDIHGILHWCCWWVPCFILLLIPSFSFLCSSLELMEPRVFRWWLLSLSPFLHPKHLLLFRRSNTRGPVLESLITQDSLSLSFSCKLLETACTFFFANLQEEKICWSSADDGCKCMSKLYKSKKSCKLLT